jgi:hypothetical protein
VNRGYDAKTLSADGKLQRPTATCGALIYRGDAFPSAYRGNAFVPEPGANLVKRFTMSETDGLVKATNTAKGSEFLTSTDERFRPVNACNGPDGALYLVDMYRGIIQHQSFLTHYLIANIQARKLEQPFNMGRIWRIVPEGSSAKPVKVSKDAKLLTHANGWVRDTAQRLIVESADTSAVPALKELLQNDSPIAREHALWTLDGLAAITPDLVKTALTDPSEHVRAAAARVAPRDYVFSCSPTSRSKRSTMPHWSRCSPRTAKTPSSAKPPSPACGAKKPPLPKHSLKRLRMARRPSSVLWPN